MTEHDTNTIQNLTAVAIFDQLQPQLMADPYINFGPAETGKEKAFRRGFRRGLGQALQWASEACRNERDMDEYVAEIERRTAAQVLARVRGYNEGHAAWIADRIAPEFGVEVPK